MKPVIFGVLAFVLGLGGSTGVMVLTTPVRLTAADSLAIARADTTHGGHATPSGPLAGATHAAPAPAPHAAAAAPAATPAAAIPAGAPVTAALASTAASPAPVVTHVPAPAPAATPVVARPTNAPDAESFKQVGSILLNMKPAEAAKIMSYLNDDQVEGLLRSMSPRQAAGVLAQLSPERGAVLSRRLLVPVKEVRP